MSSSEKVRVELTSSADTSGVDKMAEASKKLTGGNKSAAESAFDASQKSKDLGGALGKNVEVGSQAVTMMSSLGNVSKGGAEGLAAAARSGLAFFTMIKGAMLGAGPVSVAIIAITALAGVVYGLVKAFAAPKQSIEEFKTKLAELDKASLKQLDATVSALADRLKAAKEEADAVRQSMDMVDEAEMGAKLAANKASGLDPKEQARQELLIRDEFKLRKQAREREAAELARDQAKERRDALAPEFDDRRSEYADRLNENNEVVSRDREIARLKEDMAREVDRVGYSANALGLFGDFKKLEAMQPDKDGRARMDAERESARVAFEGADGKGGIAAQYNAAAAAADKAEKALGRLLDTRKKVDEWDTAKVRIENGGVDPRATEATARQSPGVARMIGPDGAVSEYGVTAPQTINQGISAAADAARIGPLAPAPNVLQRGGGALPGDGQPKDDRIQIDAKPLAKGLSDSAGKLKGEIDKQLAQIANTAAAQSVALTATANAASALAAKQAQTDAAVAQLQSQVANMRP